jgi:hypothetical protein
VRSPARLRRSIGVALIVSVCVAAASGSAQTRSTTGGRTSADIQRAIDKVKADPNLATEQTIKSLKWKSGNETKSSGMPSWLMWLVNLFRWLNQSARALVWCAAAVLAGLLGVYISRMIRARARGEVVDAFAAPTHVRDLDIRPETLPDDIGAAARALWDRGEHRAALALLYRGMLSRLAHVHRVPIRDSSTEGDCLALAVTHLSEDTHEYTSRLVRVWQRAVYGQESTMPEAIYALCEGFASALDRARDTTSLDSAALDSAANGSAV